LNNVALLVTVFEFCLGMTSIGGIGVAILHQASLAQGMQQLPDLPRPALDRLRWRSMLQNALVSVAVLGVLAHAVVDLGGRWTDGRLGVLGVGSKVLVFALFGLLLFQAASGYMRVSAECRTRDESDGG